MRHIPKCGTNEIEILMFEDALKRSLKPSEEYDIEKWLFVPNFYSEYRYILGTKGENPLVCIGINPSTARPDALDPTLKSVERIALANGFDSFIMFNVYSQRATDPSLMEKQLNEQMHSENMKAFRYILSLYKENRPSIWAAWGNIIETRDYLIDCVTDMIKIGESCGAKWYSAGKRSVKGHPHHPLYLKSNSPLDEFDIRKYCESIKG
ncbi:MAG: DUF1643 domain-containing protein [Ruminococcus sp.]|nr:DUF1643 domain-containing protein [Ruminococcus sp.]